MRQKIKKTPVTKKQKESDGIVLRIREARVTGTEYENKVMEVCSNNRYPLTFKDGKVGNKVPDFINRERKRILEVYNPGRTDEEVYARLLAFHTKSFKIRQLVKHDLISPDWKPFLTGIIGRFLNQ